MQRNCATFTKLNFTFQIQIILPCFKTIFDSSIKLSLMQIPQGLLNSTTLFPFLGFHLSAFDIETLKAYILTSDLCGSFNFPRYITWSSLSIWEADANKKMAPNLCLVESIFILQKISSSLSFLAVCRYVQKCTQLRKLLFLQNFTTMLRKLRNYSWRRRAAPTRVTIL